MLSSLNFKQLSWLLVAWQKASEAYSSALAVLSRKIGVVPRPEYQRLAEAAEKARRDALEAKAKLEKHTTEHGCDSHGEAVA
jgi:hypothetical protein